MSLDAKRRAERAGRLAEFAAVLHLTLRGWRVLARNWRCKAGEIDLVARRRHTLAFIEVKHRAGFGAAGEAIRQRQQARIARAAELFLATRPDLGGLAVTFDAILVVPWRLPSHIRDAWRID